MSRIITVVGATGAQGKGVVDALLKNGKWAVRALTRSVDSAAAKSLKSRGVEVVAADWTKSEDMDRAFKGAYGVFLMTSPQEGGFEKEEIHGKLAVDSAKKNNVSHLVFSSLENPEKISGGKNRVPHFTSKARVAEYMFKSGLPATGVQIACYYENWASYFQPRQGPTGEYDMVLPIPTDSKFAIGSVADLGKVVEKVFEDKPKYLGKTISVAGDYLSTGEIAGILSKAWGKKVNAKQIPGEVFSTFFPLAGEIADMFSWFDGFGYCGEKVNKRDIFEGKKIVPELKTFEQYVKESLSAPPAAQH